MVTTLALVFFGSAPGTAAEKSQVEAVIQRGLDWTARRQSRVGHWTANDGRYPTAMTALAGNALLCEGSNNAG